MSPRSLLFSSDQETSHLVSQVLRDLGIEVEACPEIFSAIEKLTTKVFDLVIADMDDGAEATFLLKTCIELNSTQSALSVAILGPSVSAAQAGVALVLNKPLIPDRIKWTLAHCEPLTAKLAQSKPEVVAVQPAGKRPSAISGQLPSAPKPAVAKPALPKQIGSLPTESLAKAIEAPYTPTTADFPDSGTEIEHNLVPLAESANHKFRGTTHTAALKAKTMTANYVDDGSRVQVRADHGQQNTSFTRVYRPLIMGSLMLGLAYIGVQPARSEALVSSVAVIYTKAVENTQSWLLAKKTQDAVEEAQIEAPVERNRALRLRQRAEVIRLQSTAPKITLPEVEVAKPPANATAGAESAIPNSLRASFQTVSQDPGPAVDAKLAPPSIVSAMQPVQVSEEDSRGMVVDKVVPEYPKQAVSVGMQGPVVLQALIDKDGTISDLKLVRGYMALGKAASDAVKLWHFRPYTQNGHAVDAQIYITVDFKMPTVASVPPSNSSLIN